MQTRRKKSPARPKKAAATDVEQGKRFIEAAREAGCSEDEAVFDEVVKRIAKPGRVANPSGGGKNGRSQGESDNAKK
jgi:hypothetical protein